MGEAEVRGSLHSKPELSAHGHFWACPWAWADWAQALWALGELGISDFAFYGHGRAGHFRYGHWAPMDVKNAQNLEILVKTMKNNTLKLHNINNFYTFSFLQLARV